MKLDGISSKDIKKSLNPNSNRNNVFKAGQGAGKSGSFFFFSQDSKLIVKTLRGKEKDNLLNMIEPMIRHFKKT